MANPDKTIDPKILKSAKEQFLRFGYEKASTNIICKNAGVTWGALAKRYANKDALFTALIQNVAEEFKTILKGNYQDFEEMPVENQKERAISFQQEDLFFVEYVYSHFDEFRLLVLCSSGSSYENYLDDLVEIVEVTTKRFIERSERLAIIDGVAVNDTTIHILVSSYLYGMFEPVKLQMEKDDAVVYLRQLKYFYDIGWAHILGLN